MKKNLSFLFCMIIFFQSFGQKGPYLELKKQLSLVEVDTSSLRPTQVIVSDEISDENAKDVVAAFDSWGMPLHNVDFVFTGKRNFFKKKLGKNILEKKNAFVDSKSVWKEQMGSDQVMEVYYSVQNEIVKQASVGNLNFQAEFVNLRAWDSSMPYVETLTPDPKKLLSTKTKAPQIKAFATTGVEIDLGNLKGSIVVLNFWADRCAWCIVEMPILNRLRSEYQNQNVIFLSIYKDSPESLEPYFSDTKPYFRPDFITFPIIANAESILVDYKIESFPKTYIIDQDGVIAHTSGFTIYGDESYDFNGVKSDNPYYYLTLKGTIDRLLAKGKNQY